VRRSFWRGAGAASFRNAAQSDKLSAGLGLFGGFDAPANPFAFVIAAALVGEIQTASAQSPTSYPWCARYYVRDGSPTGCYFTSYETCRATVSGIGGLCFQSPYYHAPVAAAVGRRR
jgi:hypothetical protein